MLISSGTAASPRALMRFTKRGGRSSLARAVSMARMSSGTFSNQGEVGLRLIWGLLRDMGGSEGAAA